MDRVAIFVDAGYLFAQGSTCISGKKVPRSSMVLDAAAAIREIKELASSRTPECRLLRVYWYDGALYGARPTTDQVTLAHLDDVKLRLGFVNSHGQQKGVDSLIVTDLIELARLKSISDAILLSGDEDVRVGVQIAQNHGVRVHLVGIHPARGSQSQQLMQEADTTIELHKETIAKFLSERAEIVDSSQEPVQAESASVAQNKADDHGLATIQQTVLEFVTTLDQVELQGVAVFWKTERGIPPDIDRKLLPKCGQSLGRKLERSEIREMRSQFQIEASKRIKNSN